jgi:O-antigen/teichoic acid export membrane protein
VKESRYLRNIFVLLTGTTLSQAVPIIASPLLTRLYTPNDFGVFAFIMSFVFVLSSISSFRYDIAILLPKTKRHAQYLMELSSCLLIMNTVAILLFVVFYSDLFIGQVVTEENKSWLYSIPFLVLFYSTYQLIIYWNIRSSMYSLVSRTKIINTTLCTLIQLVFYGFTLYGLVAGFIAGLIVSLVYLYKSLNIHLFFWDRSKLMKMYVIARRYKKFPLFDFPATGFNMGSFHLPNILLGIYYGPQFAAFFYLTQRVLQAPITIIASSISDAFKVEAKSEYDKTGKAVVTFSYTLKKLIQISLVPTVFLYFFIDEAFIFIFGQEWAIAGAYSQILVPALFFRFLSNPLSFMFYIAEQQLLNLLTMVALFLFVTLALVFGGEHITAIKYISGVYVLYYLSHLFLCARFAGIKISKRG